MSVTSGNYTVGSGGTYATWALAAADIGATLTGNLTFTQISALSTASAVTFPTFGLSTFTLKFTSSLSHLGSPLGGYKTTLSSAIGFEFPFTGWSGAGKILFEDFYFSKSSGWAVSVASGGPPVVFRNVLFEGTGTFTQILWTSGSGSGVEMFNVKAWNMVGSVCPVIVGAFGASSCKLENVSCYSTSGSIYDFSNITAGATKYIKNCFGYCAGTGTPFANYGGLVSSYNASSGTSATGTGSITGLAAGDFISLSPSSPNFLNIRPNSILAIRGTSTSISENVLGIRGNDRPGRDGAYSIGADESDPIGSVQIDGGPFLAARWPKPKITPSTSWVQDSAKYWNGSDRTAAQDAYETTCLFVDKESNLNALDSYLGGSREAVSLSEFAYPIFAPNVDHTGTISAVVVSRKRKHLKWGYPKATAQVYALEVVFRAISPTILATTPSLSTLKLQEGFEAGDSWESPKEFTYNQTALYGDNASDIGTFRGQFIQTTPQLQAILAYLLTTVRATAFAFPNIGVAYPFGVNRGVYTGKNCKWKSIEITRRDFVFWDLSLELVEAP